jgi:hypothetical protein
MKLLVKVIPLSAGAAERAGDPEMLACPPDVEADALLSLLTGRFGDPIETAWTSTERHPRIETGWIFAGPRGDEPAGGIDILCVPFIECGGGSLRPLFEWLADQRQDFEELASRGALEEYRVIELPQRDYRPAAGEGDEGRGS